MMYVTMRNGERVYFGNIDEMFKFINTNEDAVGGWVSS